ncbi:unnamed protein product [Cylicocyclus nassatus]|uniref:Peptidase M13 N-terminal domain-containing protein n=1 Tax=Cylicocyclus nassatus TaxID=53992 RepID=A0AA36M950_CYLNA|nr:unnamed protein product [Cylicocyclus nassatus]
MSQYSPSFGTSPLPPASPQLVAEAPIAEPEPDIVDYGLDNNIERTIEEDVLEVLDNVKNGLDTYRAEPCKSSPSIPQQSLSFPKAVEGCHKAPCSKCNLWLSALLGLFFLLSIGLFIVWAITSRGFSNLGSIPRVCTSRDCIDTAFRFTNNIDDTVDPCENFYRYSCGKYHSQDLEKQKSFAQIQEEATHRALYGLLSSSDSNDTSRSARLARDVFASCMNTDQRTKAGYAPLLDRLRNLPCGPLLSGCNFNPGTYSWERHSGMLGWYAGQYNLVVFDTDVHPQERTQITLQFRPPDLSKIVDPVRDDLIRLANPGPTEFDTLLQVQLKQSLAKTTLLKLIQPDEKQRQNMLEEVSDLMVDIYKISTGTPSNITYMTFDQLKRAVPQIAWDNLLYAELSTVMKLADTSTISVINLVYFEQLALVASRHSAQALANYLVVAAARHLEQYIYNDEPSWIQCVENLKLFEPVQKLYILSRSNDYKLEKIKFYLMDIKRMFILSHQAKFLRYLGEINRIAFLVGYPRRLTDENLVWKPLATMVADPNDYFGTIIRLLKQQSTYRLSQVGTYLDTDDSTTFDVLLPTLQFNPQLSTMVVPLAFLQAPISYPKNDAPKYSIYGSLGVTVNHFLAKLIWPRVERGSQKQCLVNIFRGYLSTLYRNNADFEDEILRTIELSDALDTTSYSYIALNGNNTTREQKLPGFDNFDDVQNMMMTFGTMFCNRDGAQPGSPYEAMINTVATNTKLLSQHFKCLNSSAIFYRRQCL